MDSEHVANWSIALELRISSTVINSQHEYLLKQHTTTKFRFNKKRRMPLNTLMCIHSSMAIPVGLVGWDWVVAVWVRSGKELKFMGRKICRTCKALTHAHAPS